MATGFAGWLKANWATISAVFAAVASVLWPGSEDTVARALAIVAALLGDAHGGRTPRRPSRSHAARPDPPR